MKKSIVAVMNRRFFVRSLAAAALTDLNVVPITTAPVPAVSKSLTSRQAASDRPYVVDARYLHAQVEADSAAIRIIDVSPIRTYRSSHIPGAIHAFWEDTIDREYPHFGAVVTQGDNQRLRIEFVRELGLDPAMAVVVYDNSYGFRAARIVWFLRFLGFEQVTLLDGGLSAWQDEGLPVQSGVNSIDESVTSSVAPQNGFYVVTEQLLGRIETRSPLIVDTRTDDERNDDLDGSLPLGTIPGSVRFPWTGMIDANSNRLWDPDQLRPALDEPGLTMDREIVLFARFGVDAALPWLVLKHLGYPSVETYDRGWVEWASRPDLERAPL